MAGDNSLIDQIVNGVLKQLGTTDDRDARSSSATTATVPKRSGLIELTETVITADVLYEQASQAATVTIPKRSIITPAAWDVIKELGIDVERPETARPSKSTNAQPANASASVKRLLIVVRHTDAVDRLWHDLQSGWRRELLGCPDDAAKLAISELTRGEASSVVILAEQSHRAACLANRHENAKAAVVRDAADVKVVSKQLRTNVWCIDPTGKSWFELRNLFRAIG